MNGPIPHQQRRADRNAPATAPPEAFRTPLRTLSPAAHALALDTSRSWMTTCEIESDRLAALIPVVNEAIGNLAERHRRVLQTWAWVNHYNRSVVRKVEGRVDEGVSVFWSNRAILTEENMAATKVALVPRLAEEGVYVPG